ncbi:MAG: hypothetical protein HC784_06715 [Hydrococcus sp. CSU_1_8]|nr:hypothetical protein [Hydrococcus sp. CSU_1_8]
MFALLFFAQANAQVNEGFDALDQKDFATALNHFQDALSNEKERIPAMWGVAQILANPDYEQHDYDSAYVLKANIETALRKYKDAKVKKKWGRRYELNPENLKGFAKPLSELRWNEIDGSKNLRDFDRYERVFKNRMPAKAKKTFQTQHSKVRRDAVNGGAVTYEEPGLLVGTPRPLYPRFFPRKTCVAPKITFHRVYG